MALLWCHIKCRYEFACFLLLLDSKVLWPKQISKVCRLEQGFCTLGPFGAYVFCFLLNLWVKKFWSLYPSTSFLFLVEELKKRKTAHWAQANPYKLYETKGRPALLLALKIYQLVLYFPNILRLNYFSDSKGEERNTIIDIWHIFCEANMVADSLANHRHTLDNPST